jgi:hypothetical protein
MSGESSGALEALKNQAWALVMSPTSVRTPTVSAVRGALEKSPIHCNPYKSTRSHWDWEHTYHQVIAKRASSAMS